MSEQLQPSINQPCMFVGGKRSTQKKPKQLHKEHAKTFHTGRLEPGQLMIVKMMLCQHPLQANMMQQVSYFHISAAVQY